VNDDCKNITFVTAQVLRIQTGPGKTAESRLLRTRTQGSVWG